MDALGLPWVVPDTGDFFHLKGYNCWEDGSSTPLAKLPGAIAAHSTVTQCKLACRDEAHCVGFIMGEKKQPGQCWLRSAVSLEKCKRTPGRDLSAFDFFLKRNMTSAGKSTAETLEFYMYRASAEGMLQRYGLSEVNTGNVDGVLWYLMNEIVTVYSSGVRCPRRFDISKMHRFKVKVKPTRPLSEDGLNFGVRFAYDQGKCEGRCFEGNKCSGEGDCAAHYQQYGFVVGCNRFNAHYPFPGTADGAAPWGVWYSLPVNGRCKGEPTGEKDCTWSFEHAGEITLKELEDLSPGNENCCNNHCTNFWHDPSNPGAMSWRVHATVELFKKKYPELPGELPAPPCDFDAAKWYAQDPWHKQDPWR